MGFHHGLSGLNAASKSLDVSGHNIANSNTIGFKKSRAEFNEMVASAMGSGQCPGSAGAGIGVSVAAVTQQFSQGVITPTANGLDMAINGDGFFVVNTPSGTAYTRNGAFQLDKSGQLVTANGDKVMGYPLDPVTGNKSGTLNAVTFPTGAPIPAKQTSGASLTLNLDARAEIGVSKSRATYGTSLQVFDSQGVATPLSFYFDKVGANTWNVFNGLDDSKASPPVVAPSTGQVVADATGEISGVISLKTPLPSTPADLADATKYPKEVTYKFYGPDKGSPPESAIREVTISGANPSDIWDFSYDPTDPNIVISAQLKNNLTTNGALTLAPPDMLDAPKAAVQSFGLDLEVDPHPSNPNSPPSVGGVPGPDSFNVSVNLDGLTQYGTSFSVAKITQDGYASGELTGVSVSGDGTLMASYSNGITRPEAQVALARFTNPQGLAPNGNNNWVQTNDSGPVLYGSAGSGSFGQITGCAQEESNVDLTAELVGMMTAQRFYQANAQTIKTQDQVFSTLVNLR